MIDRKKIPSDFISGNKALYILGNTSEQSNHIPFPIVISIIDRDTESSSIVALNSNGVKDLINKLIETL